MGFVRLPTSTEVGLGATVDLVSGPDLVARHDMASLVIAMFGEDPASGTSWQSAAPYFWPVMYDDVVAVQIGMGNVAGKLKEDGDNGEDGKYSQILRQIIAYSAIDEGGTVVNGENAARPFGDVAIRALYDDANDLGVVLAGTGVSQVVTARATDISKAFVQFAGQMALEKVLQSENPETLAGVLSVSGDMLSVNFSDDLWSTSGTAVPNMFARTSSGLPLAIFPAANDNKRFGCGRWLRMAA